MGIVITTYSPFLERRMPWAGFRSALDMRLFFWGGRGLLALAPTLAYGLRPSPSDNAR